MLQHDLGVSRILLTCYRSPYNVQNMQATRVRSFLISRISLPEGVALLQRRGIQGSYEELSIVWQRCGGHSFALVLFSALFKLSGLSLSYLLNSPNCQSLWTSEVPLRLIAAIYHRLTPVQHILMRALSLFSEPVPAQGPLMAIMGEKPAASLPLFEQELAFLTRLSLVQKLLNEENQPRYALHPLFRQYILE